MSRPLLFIAVLLALAAIPAGLALGDSPAPGPRTIKLKERGGSLKALDLPPRARTAHSPASPGDEVVFTRSLTSADGRAAGTFHAVCVVTKPHGGIETSLYQCSGTYVLTDGTLALDFAGSLSGQSRTFAITGGTGNYAGARGTVASVGGTDTIDLLA
jgi:hypothetical protein